MQFRNRGPPIFWGYTVAFRMLVPACTIESHERGACSESHLIDKGTIELLVT